MTPLAPIDAHALEAFWARAVESGAVDASEPMPSVVERFGDHREMADELLALIVDGPKRATVALLAELEHDGDELPVEGGLWIVADGDGRARALLRTTEVRIGPLSSVDDAFAWDEGEGDRTRSSWLTAHEGYFRRRLPAIGVDFDPDLATVFERFALLHAESA